MLSYMQNDLEEKLNATMNNTAEINAKLSDSIVMRNACKCKTINCKSSKVKKDDCVNYVKVNTCRDIIINKDSVMSNVMQ